MDWHSRYVLAWDISTTMDVAFCTRTLEKALKISKPEIFNSDQGSQFTSDDFTGILKREGISISMDGRGRVSDNIFVERLWRTVKYEEVYLHQYMTVSEARRSLNKYFLFYNSFPYLSTFSTTLNILNNPAGTVTWISELLMYRGLFSVISSTLTTCSLTFSLNFVLISCTLN